MSTRMLRDLLDRVDLTDPHEFATAFATHVDSARATGKEALSVTAGSLA